MIIEGMGEGRGRGTAAKSPPEKNGGQAIDSLPKAFGGDAGRLSRRPGPPAAGGRRRSSWSGARVAADDAVENSGATSLLALLLAGQNRDDEALALLRSVPASDPLMPQVRDVHRCGYCATTRGSTKA